MVSVDLKKFALDYTLLTVAVWLAIPVALGLLPTLGFDGALGGGAILIAATPAFASIFMAKLYTKRVQHIPAWKFIGRLMLILVPMFVVLGLLLNGLGTYLMFMVVNATTPNDIPLQIASILNIKMLSVVNTAFSAVLGVGVIFPLRVKGELRKIQFAAANGERKD